MRTVYPETQFRTRKVPSFPGSTEPDLDCAALDSLRENEGEAEADGSFSSPALEEFDEVAVDSRPNWRVVITLMTTWCCDFEISLLFS